MANPLALDDPFLMVVEMEAYLTFRLITPDGQEPNIPKDEIIAIKRDLVECIRRWKEKHPERFQKEKMQDWLWRGGG